MNIGDDANRLAAEARAQMLIDRQRIGAVEVVAAALDDSSADS